MAATPSGDPGLPVTCIDARSGIQFQYHAQHLFSSGVIDSAWIPDSSHVCLGSVEGGAQLIVGDATGGEFIAWINDDGLEPDIAVQRLTAQGTPASGWENGGVAVCRAGNAQYQLSADSDHEGGVLLTWADYRRGSTPSIYLQRVSDAGAPVSGWSADGVAASTLPSEQLMPSVSADGSGGGFVAWLDRRSGALALYGQHASAAGAIDAAWPSEAALLASPTSHGRISLVRTIGDGAGHVFVVWRNDDDSLGTSLNGAWLALASPPTTGSLPSVLSLSSGALRLGDPALSRSSDGSVTICWGEWRETGKTLRITRVTSGGSLVAGFQSGGNVLATGSIGVGAPAIMSDWPSGAIVSWEDHSHQDGGDIYATRLRGDGTLDPAWPDGGLPICTARGDQSAPTLAPDGNGGAIATWIDAGTEAVAGYLSLKPSGTVEPPRLLATQVDPGHVRIVWRVSPNSGSSYHAFRRQGDSDWQLLSDLAPNDSLLVTLDDPLAPAKNVDYRLGVDWGGVFVPFDPVAVTVPAVPAELALTRVWGSPGDGGISIEFALPRGPEARADVIDIAGRRVLSQSLGSLAPGSHQVLLRPSGRLSAGIYFVRLVQGPQTLSHKVVFIH